MFWNLLNRFRPKQFRPKFLTLSFFTILDHFSPKTTESKEKSFTGDKFRFRDFRFKVRSETFWIHSDQKKCSTKIFLLCYFSLFWPFWPKNDRVSRKKITWENIFDFEIFGLKHVLKHSDSILTKKIWPIFFDFVIFSLFWAFSSKIDRVREKVMGEKFSEIFSWKYVLIHSDSIPTKKNFEQNFLTLSFSLSWPLWPKTIESQKKICTGKNSRF